MLQRISLPIFLVVALVSTAFAQKKRALPTVGAPQQALENPKMNWPPAGRETQNAPFDAPEIEFRTLGKLAPRGLEVERTDDLGFFIRSKNAAETDVFAFLQSIASTLGVRDAEAEFKIQKDWTDAETGRRHVRLVQIFQNLEVEGAEVVAHTNEKGLFETVNGRLFPTPSLSTSPILDEKMAIEKAKTALGSPRELTEKELFLVTGKKQAAAALVIFHENERPEAEKLAWRVLYFVDAMHRNEIWIDAATGAVLQRIDRTCSIHGGRVKNFGHRISDIGHVCSSQKSETAEIENPRPEVILAGPNTGTGLDLLDVNRTFDTYQVGSTNYLINAAESMHTAQAAAQSTFPTDPVSVIWTMDSKNTSPSNSNFDYVNLTNAATTWTGANNKKAVSAHWNSKKSYDYFEQKHGRKSINDAGGSIIALFNVSDEDGSSMGNAFWNGEAIFYGSGDATFKPLQRALDVAGHEMSHGVVEKTANLTYQGESGAMNESFADIFGAMIDLGDWKMGEDVMISTPTNFPSGALRDLSNPHNGGSSLNDPWWQPAHVNEKYNGTQDNGGVHINSGIPNNAYYRFATNSAVGTDKAEKVFYKALDAYLVKSSKFKDLRVAVLQAATDLYGVGNAVVLAAASAFDAVGITGAAPPTGGGTPPTPPGGNYQIDLQANPGTEYMLVTENDYSKLDLLDASGEFVFQDYLYQGGVKSRPSATDRGNEIVFVNDADEVVYLTIDWAAKTYKTSIISSPGEKWHNVIISKDGQLLAATEEPQNNKIVVFDAAGTPKSFTLFNPTYSNDPQTTNEVQYADVMEFDYSGQSIMYDAFNKVSKNGINLEWWDIGFVDVWKKTASAFGDGKIEKLFSGLPENVSIGNPVFSKNSPHIIAFDYFNDTAGEYAVLGANTQSGDNGDIAVLQDLGYPTWSRLDNKVAFEAGATGSENVSTHGVAASKIAGTGATALFKISYQWPVYIANGTRSLAVSTQNIGSAEALAAFPNPLGDESLTVKMASKKAESGLFEIISATGQIVFSKKIDLEAGENAFSASFAGLPSGAFLVRLTTESGRTAMAKAVKI